MVYVFIIANISFFSVYPIADQSYVNLFISENPLDL